MEEITTGASAFVVGKKVDTKQRQKQANAIAAGVLDIMFVYKSSGGGKKRGATNLTVSIGLSCKLLRALSDYNCCIIEIIG